jgi:hypothetical protein
MVGSINADFISKPLLTTTTSMTTIAAAAAAAKRLNRNTTALQTLVSQHKPAPLVCVQLPCRGVVGTC